MTTALGKYDWVFDKLVTLMETGTAPWSKSWKAGLPKNATTGHVYTGGNTWICWAAQITEGFSTSGWVTPVAAKKLGLWPRKGSQLTWLLAVREIFEDDPKDPTKRRLKARYPKIFLVANLDQLDGDAKALEELRAKVVANANFEPVAAAEALMVRTGAQIEASPMQPRYSPTTDTVSLPARDQYPNPEDFYVDAFHELIHWTGHAKRLDRFKGGYFGDERYSFEELVAELGAAFVCSTMGLAPKQHSADYIRGWGKRIQADRALFAKAAAAAAKAADFLLGTQAAEEAA